MDEVLCWMPGIHHRRVHHVSSKHECFIFRKERSNVIIKMYKTYQDKVFFNQGLLRCRGSWFAILPHKWNVGGCSDEATSRSIVQRYASIPTKLLERLRWWPGATGRRTCAPYDKATSYNCYFITGVCWWTVSERVEFGIKSNSRQKTKYEAKEQQSKMRILDFPFQSKW